MTKYFRSILSCLLAIVLLASMLPMSASAASAPFSDVSPSDWFSAPVAWAVDNNITGGIGNGKFGPNNPCTRAQVVTFLWAANGKPEPQNTINPFTDVPNNAWYLKPVLWAVEKGITGGTSNNTFSPDNECTRAQIVTFLYAAAGKPAVSGSSEFIDVRSADWFAAPVIWAKENDITGGTGPNTFGPLNICTRGQVVTFLYKAYGSEPQPTAPPTAKPTATPAPTAKPTPEITPAPVIPDTPALNAEQIYAQCSSAVFYIEVYDRYGDVLGTGSGVFLTSDGLAITNHHVIDGAHSANIMTTDGTVYHVAGYYDAKEAIDMALLQIDGSGFNYMTSAESTTVAGGQNIFAIGSPKGLDNTISSGIISNPKRIVDGIDFIQMTAPISPGSSGGALINDKGELIGINTAYIDGQNLNLAVPIYHLNELSTDTLHKLPVGASAPTYSGASLSFEPTLTVQVGITEAVRIVANPGNCTEPVTIYFENDDNICNEQWNDWNGWEIDLYITGNEPGTVTIPIGLELADGTVLVENELTVTVVTSKPVSKSQLAYDALAQWIAANYTDVSSDGELCHYYEEKSATEMFAMALMMPPDRSSITLSVGFMDNESEFYVFHDLTPDAFSAFSTLTYFYLDISEYDPIFSASALVDRASFCESSKLELFDIEGDASLASDFEDLLKYTLLSGLSYIDEEIYGKYIPSYNIHDLGYTNLYN